MTKLFEKDADGLLHEAATRAAKRAAAEAKLAALGLVPEDIEALLG